MNYIIVYLKYASEWRTRLGLGGTATNNGSGCLTAGILLGGGVGVTAGPTGTRGMVSAKRESRNKLINKYKWTYIVFLGMT